MEVCKLIIYNNLNPCNAQSNCIKSSCLSINPASCKFKKLLINDYNIMTATADCMVSNFAVCVIIGCITGRVFITAIFIIIISH